MNEKILYRFITCNATQEEEKAVLDWLDADPDNRRELDRLDALFAAGLYEGMLDAGRKPAAPLKKRAPLRRRILGWTAAAAAVIAVSFALGSLMTSKRMEGYIGQTTAIEVPAGQRMHITLGDNTSVWLNAGTRIEYPSVFMGKERRVKVEGEAMFDVEYDARKPFVVETFACDVRVLGTKFNVAADRAAGSFSTALIRGSVSVSSRLVPSESITIAPDETVTLVEGHLRHGTIRDRDAYRWPDGIISIYGLDFAELMAKFERAYGVRIVIERGKLPAVNYTSGKIRVSDGIDHALKVLQMASEFSYRRDTGNNSIIIY